MSVSMQDTLAVEKRYDTSSGWERIDSAYMTIYYQPGVDLKSVERKLRQRSLYIAGKPKLPPLAETSEKIAYRLDLIFEKAREILDMRPRRYDLAVKIFESRKDMTDMYESIFNERKETRSFYVYKTGTIYTNERDISDSVIAHEIAHSIVDHYFVVLPPSKVKEMLAGYVDLHLDE